MALRRVPEGSLEPLWGAFWVVLGLVWSSFGGLWGSFGGLFQSPGALLGLFFASWEPPGSIFSIFGQNLKFYALLESFCWLLGSMFT